MLWSCSHYVSMYVWHYMNIIWHCMHVCTCVVRVKWGKQKFDGVEVDTDEPPSVFKMQLFSLSGNTAYFIPTYTDLFLWADMFLISYLMLGVPPDRQKVMISGTTLGDDDWGKAKPKIKEVCEGVCWLCMFTLWTCMGEQLLCGYYWTMTNEPRVAWLSEVSEPMYCILHWFLST